MISISIITGTNSRKAGGLFNSVKSLAKHINKIEDIELSVFSHDDEFSNEDISTWGNLPMTKYNIKGPHNFAYTTDLNKLLQSKGHAIIHQQGIWTFPSKCTLDQKKRFNTKTIITPRGMLDPWAINNSRFKKQIVGHWFEYKNLKSADCIHALCDSEYLSIREFGLKNPVAIIPNGINLPIHLKLEKSNIKRAKRKLLFVGRIHPKKGLEFLLKAFAKIKIEQPQILENWIFEIAGWSQEGHQEVLERYCDRTNLNKFVKFIGPIYDSKKEELLLNADAFILPSLSEGLPMSVLEAWSYKLPVAMTEACNLPEGFENNAAYKINHDISALPEQLIQFLLFNDRELRNFGSHGYELVKNKFAWEIIAQETSKLYDWLLNGDNEPPSFIKLN